MGQTLGEPITTKETASCANSYFKVGSSSMQGWRISMEDAHTHFLSLPDDNNAAFFAVYDGHGGPKVSQYASLHLHKCIVNNHHYAEGNPIEAIKRGFLEFDEQMLNDAETKEEMSGTTAITVLIKDFTIYCGNVGDSRAVASVRGEAVPLSFDHKPANEEESRRICAAGGWVEFNRVNGNLALSRALGDFGFKQNLNKSPEEQIVTAFPEVHKFEITPDFEFLVLACDGIWDVMSSQEVITFCRERLAEGKEPEIVCEELLERCLAPDCELSGLGCDNMTAILVCLLKDRPVEEWIHGLQETPSKPNPICIIDPEADEHFTTPCQSPKDSRMFTDESGDCEETYKEATSQNFSNRLDVFFDPNPNEPTKGVDSRNEEMVSLSPDTVTLATEFETHQMDGLSNANNVFDKLENTPLKNVQKSENN